jgi:hypothetical protein
MAECLRGRFPRPAASAGPVCLTLHRDGFIERVLAGTDKGTAPMYAHLASCGACGEEAGSFLLLAAEDEGVDPGPGLRRLEAR